MAKIKTKTNDKSKKTHDEYSFMSWLTAAWVMMILAFLPIYTHNSYADILTTKYGVVLVAGGMLTGGFLLWVIFARRISKYIARMKTYADPETGKWFWNWCKATFSILDIFVLAFFLISVVSTLCSSPYMYQAFFGNEGRWNGELLFLILVFSYFIVSRYYRFRSWHITVFLLAFAYICVWAITNYFRIDIFHFKEGITPEHYDIFVSSIGNIDTFTAMAMIPFAFAGIMFIQSDEKLWKIIFYWVVFGISMVSMITSAADNAYLSFFAFYIFTPFIALKTRKGLRRFLITAATFVSAIQLVITWNFRFGEAVVKPTGVISICENIPQLKYLMIALWIIVLAVYIYDLAVKKAAGTTPLPKIWLKIWLVIVILVFGVLIALFIMANTGEGFIPSLAEPARDYLVFDNDWGTWRGLVWKKLMSLYEEFPLLQKLIGTGPETIGIYLYNFFFEEIAAESHLMFDSPHNELLQMFLNVGMLGLISYLGILISPSVLAAKRTLKKSYPFIAAVGMVCICHIFECFVNLMVPMDIPVIFGLIAIADGLYRKSANEVEG